MLGAPLCMPCPNGTASGVTAATSNTTCQACVGSYALLEGSAACTPCPNASNGFRAANFPSVVLELCADTMDSAAPRSAGRTDARSTALLAAAVAAVALRLARDEHGGRLPRRRSGGERTG
jgi:hypothetical protein